MMFTCMRKAIYFIVVFLCTPAFAIAQVVPSLGFTEIMYDLEGSDSGKEWAEVFNYGIDPVSIVAGSAADSYRFFDGSLHTLQLAQGTTTIPAGGFAVLADNAESWLVAHPQYSGILFDTVLSLK